LLFFEALESPVSCSMPSTDAECEANALSDELKDESRSMTGAMVERGSACCCPPSD